MHTCVTSSKHQTIKTILTKRGRISKICLSWIIIQGKEMKWRLDCGVNYSQKKMNKQNTEISILC